MIIFNFFSLDGIKLYQKIIEKIIKKSLSRDLFKVILNFHRSKDFLEICSQTFNIIQITEFTNSKTLDPNNPNKGLKLNQNSNSNELEIFPSPTPNCENTKKILILKNNYKIMRFLVATMLPTIIKDEYNLEKISIAEIPFKEGKNTLLVVFENFDKMTIVMNSLHEKFSDYFSSFEEKNSGIKKMVLAAFQLIDVLTGVVYETVDFEESPFSKYLDNFILKIYYICFNYLKFVDKDLNNLVNDTKYVLENINDIVGECVKFIK